MGIFKKIVICVTIFLYSCNASDNSHYCSREFDSDSIGVMIEGGIGNKYDNGKTWVTIQKIDKHNWDNNEYFTGSGFSKNKTHALRLSEADECELKRKYFQFLDNKK